jgi:histone-lysine N-methyltransferase ASH1L
MFYECDDTNCKLGEKMCGNRSFGGLRQRCKAGGKYNIGVEVIKTVDRGYGVRSNRTFEPNQIIVEYTGEIITQEECERRMRTVYKKNEVRLLALNAYGLRLTITNLCSAIILCTLIRI